HLHQLEAATCGVTDLFNVKGSQCERTRQCTELHSPVERNQATDEPAFHLLLETTLKPSQRDKVRPVWKKVQKQQLQSFPQRQKFTMLRIIPTVRLEKPQKSDFFALGNKAPCHFERNDATKRSATEIIRATWLMHAQRVDVGLRYSLD